METDDRCRTMKIKMCAEQLPMKNESLIDCSVSRRQFLVGGMAAAGALLLPSRQLWCAPEKHVEPPGGFRFVHLTDIHVQPERRADEGFAKCIDAVESLNPKPDFILAGGDLVYDAAGQ